MKYGHTIRINYLLASEGVTQIFIYDILGRRIAILVNNYHLSGLHNVSWNPVVLSSGIFLCRFVIKNADNRVFEHTMKINMTR